MHDGRPRLDLDELTGNDVSDDGGGSDGGLRWRSGCLLGRQHSPRVAEIWGGRAGTLGELSRSLYRWRRWTPARNWRCGVRLIRVSGGGNEGGGYGVFIGKVSWQNAIKISQMLRSPVPFEYGARQQILSLEVEDNLTSRSQPSGNKTKKKGKGRGRGGAAAAGPRGRLGLAGARAVKATTRACAGMGRGWPAGWARPAHSVRSRDPPFFLISVFFFLR
jgi:hypothetical protein